ncbi:MAG: methylated-DNA--[protein]-cysteine S-methyltransferase [Actinobacteria bacterium]|nr:methylated-DNA--[protein]-cysteine S-methyltransferase [Actinomycetota bacterium]
MKPAVVAVFRSIASPVGILTLSASPRGLTGVQFENDIVERFVVAESFSAKEREQAAGYIATAEAQLSEYFARQRTVFAVQLDLLGTPFQVEVWNLLARIPYGETTSYGQQAKWVGRPAAVRAVGGANGRNPVAIVLPCHRVIGANGSLTGFGGGVERKIWLLEHEKWK